MRATRGIVPSGRRTQVAVSVAATFVTLIVFAIIDSRHLIPADGGQAAGLGLGAALLAGIAVFVAPLVGGRVPVARRLHRLLATWLAAVATLLTLYLLFEEPALFDERRIGSRIAFWPPCVEGSRYRCAEDESRQECLQGLGYYEDKIADCWGGGRIAAVKLALALSSLLVSGGFGGLIGLVLARRPEAEAGPLRLFLCYRRADSFAFADRLHDRLSERFGAENVFRDVEDIRLGGDFRQAVRRALARCDVFLLVIGPRWLEIRDDEGARRLDDADDPVRIEVESAIARGLLVVPVLVGGARMPRSDQMPDGFEELSNRAGAALQGDPALPGDPAFGASVDALIRQLEEASGFEVPVGSHAVPRAERTVLPETAGEQADIFVSHSSSDEASATRLVSALRAAGASVFYAPESIRTSDSFVERINRAIGGCRLAVLLWSGAAARSSWVTMEINSLIVRRTRDRLRIEVVRLEPLEVPALLADIHRIDAFPSPDADTVAQRILTGFGSGPSPSSPP